MSILDPSTIQGALIIGIIAGIISGIILGFFSGRVYERKIIKKSKSNIKGNNNTVIQDSDIRG